jgi:hypothetical protein
MQKFKADHRDSFVWRVWHGLNSMVGGVSFLIGSIFFYPYFANLWIFSAISGWLFTIGSFTFVLCDLS